jgi:hypothetical protein
VAGIERFEAVMVRLAADTSRFKVRTVAKTGRERRVFLPTLELIEIYLEELPASEPVDTPAMKRLFAQAAGADLCCPVTTKHLVSKAAGRASSAFQASGRLANAPR